MDKIMHLTFESALSDIKEKNSSFDSGILRVAYTGANRNGSYISQETFEKCIESMYNCPIVCNYDRETDTIGSHDIDIVRDDNGRFRIVNVTEPVGVIPESAKYSWETVMEDDGTVHTYLDVEALLWKRQEAYAKIKADGISAESMEINVKQGALSDDKGFVIDDFEFTAFCLLGDGVEPCFEGASLTVFSLTGMKQQITEMMNDLKDFNLSNHSKEGGGILDEKLKLCEEYGFKAEDLDFALDDISLEDLKAKFEAMRSDSVVTIDEPKATFELMSSQLKSLDEALSAETVEYSWGVESRYWLEDVDVEQSMVYMTDSSDWNLYGAPYSFEGDVATIDFANRKRMKYAIVPYDGPEETNDKPMVYSLLEDAKAYIATNSEKFAAMSAELDTAKENLKELESLREFKKNAEDVKAKADRDAIFAQFHDLDGNEAFEGLKSNCADYALDVLEEKCFAIRGRVGVKMTFSKDAPSSITIPVEHNETGSKDPYGGLIQKYGHVE